MAIETLSSGNVGLDQVLRGGLPKNRLYLLEGAPGAGKTTLALQYLLEGVRRGERVLYVTLSESAEELHAVAESHGWSLSGIEIFELSSANEVLGQGREQSIVHPWEIELTGTVRLIEQRVEALKPTRVVFDSLSEMRLLAQDPLRYRRQVLALKQFFSGRGVTVILVDDMTGNIESRDNHLHSLCHGVVTLERVTLSFGAVRRRLQVQKLRGVDFCGGFHDFTLRRGGLDVYPRLMASDHRIPFAGEPLPSGITELDALLSGGPLRGTSTLISGPAGSGKTTLALMYAYSACERGESAAIYEFDERIGTLLTRAKAMGLDLQKHVDSGMLKVLQVDPSDLSPGEFAWTILHDVTDRNTRVVVVDSLNGYLAAMPEEQQLILQMHELLAILNQRGVATFLINPQSGLTNAMGSSSIDVSYLADVVLQLRFFEAAGRIRKALSVIKNRGGAHEDAIREFRIDAAGLRVGDPLVEFRGVMTGTPEYTGTKSPLMEDRPRGG